ncbi:hypothetical protein GCM10027418_22260 [Mariniluteicoccus endophyticus]
MVGDVHAYGDRVRELGCSTHDVVEMSLVGDFVTATTPTGARLQLFWPTPLPGTTGADSVLDRPFLAPRALRSGMTRSGRDNRARARHEGTIAHGRATRGRSRTGVRGGDDRE